MTSSQCTRCHASVIWAKSVRNTWVPLDQTVVAHGIRFALHPQPDKPPLAVATDFGAGHPSHFESCTKVRKRNRAQRRAEQAAKQGGLF